MSIASLLLLTAFIVAILSAIDRAPLWVATILIIIYELIQAGGIG